MNKEEKELKEMLDLNDQYQKDRKNLSKTQREILWEYMNRRVK
ncbi:MAG: hypothetical protein ACI8XB_000661 [Patiriisocius sp.]|jgi:hypothetical protein